MDVKGAMRAIGAQAFGEKKVEEMLKHDLAASFIGFNVAPVTRPCYFTFVEDDFPLGVVPPDIISNTYFEYDQSKDTTTGTLWTSEKNYIIGFGAPINGSEQKKSGSTFYAEYNDAKSGTMGYSDGEFSDDTYDFPGYMSEVLKNPPKDNTAITGSPFTPMGGVSLNQYSPTKEAFLASIGGNNMNYFTYIVRQ